MTRPLSTGGSAGAPVTPEQTDLARRLGAELTARELWRAGVLAIDTSGTRWRLRALRDGHLRADGEGHGYIGGWPPPWEVWPDLTDDATAGVLLGLLVAESGPVVRLMASADQHPRWQLVTPLGTWTFDHPGEAAGGALLARWGTP